LPAAAKAEPSQRPATKKYVKPEAAITVMSSCFWAVCRPKHVEQLRNIGIMNSTTQLHLIGFFYEKAFLSNASDFRRSVAVFDVF
jgi:hypothetical protein